MRLTLTRPNVSPWALALALLIAAPVAAQTVTVTRPGAPPATFDCGQGCAIAVAPPVVEPPPPPPCTWTVTPTALTFGASGGSTDVLVTANRPDCSWSTTGSTEWLTLDPIHSGARVTAAANPTTSGRSATLTMAGQAVVVSQTAAIIVPPPPPPPPAGVLWRSTIASTARDGAGRLLYGFASRRVSDASWAGTYYTESRQVGVAPGGGDAVRFALLPYEGQRYIGGEVRVAAPAWGESRFLRGKIRYHMGRRNATHTQKLVIVADGAGGNRPILTIGTHFGEPSPLQMRLQIDGGAGRIDSQRLNTDTWIDWEIEINPGQSGSAGYYVLTVNGVVAGRQSRSFSDGQRSQHGNYGIGYYLNDSVGASDDWWFELADLEVRRGA
jgi:hypothetical protein